MSRHTLRLRRPRRGLPALLGMLATAIVLSGCVTGPPAGGAPTPRLAAYLNGSFVAIEPADDSEIVLRIEPVFVQRWDLEDGVFMLVALRDGRGPWLQALYRLVPDRQGRAVVESWRFRDEALNAVAEPTSPGQVEELGLQAFRHLRGCDIAFTLMPNGAFFGEHTPRGACRNSHRGADYVWAQKTITPNQMLWWERGYSEEGEVVWGPEEDGYLFERIEP